MYLQFRLFREADIHPRWFGQVDLHLMLFWHVDIYLECSDRQIYSPDILLCHVYLTENHKYILTIKNYVNRNIWLDTSSHAKMLMFSMPQPSITTGEEYQMRFQY